MNQREEFLEAVRRYISIDPEAAAFVSEHVARGLKLVLDDTRQRATDMETVAALCMKPKAKRNKEYCESLIRKWYNLGKTSFEWGWLLKRESDNEPA